MLTMPNATTAPSSNTISIFSWFKVLPKKDLLTMRAKFMSFRISFSNKFTSFVNHHVLGLCSYFKIFYSIIRTVFILMMYNFRRRQFSPKIFFHYQPMFRNLFAFYSKKFIPSTKSPHSVFSTTAKIIITEFFNTQIMFATVTLSKIRRTTVFYCTSFHGSIILCLKWKVHKWFETARSIN